MLQDGTISVRNLSCRSRSIRSRRITFVFPFSLVIGSVNATMNRSSFVLLGAAALAACVDRSEEHTSELQSQSNLVCRLLLEKKKKKQKYRRIHQDIVRH